MKNVVKKSTKVATKKQVNKVEKVTYLAEGVTGKKLMNSIFKANNEHKKDMGTFSQCLKRAIEFGANELSLSISNFNVKDLTPKVLIPLRNEKKIDKPFSVFEVLMLIKKYYQSK